MARILIVDDDPLFGAMLGHTLRREGHRPMVVDSAGIALAALDAGLQVDLVVTDILMPDMDGLELIKALRARGAGLPIVTLSSGGDRPLPNLLSMARALGADRALYKPVSATVIASIIRELLHGAPRPILIDGPIACGEHAA
jgi:CheY-like chemotaxis protein